MVLRDFFMEKVLRGGLEKYINLPLVFRNLFNVQHSNFKFIVLARLRNIFGGIVRMLISAVCFLTINQTTYILLGNS